MYKGYSGLPILSKSKKNVIQVELEVQTLHLLLRLVTFSCMGCKALKVPCKVFSASFGYESILLLLCFLELFSFHYSHRRSDHTLSTTSIKVDIKTRCEFLLTWTYGSV